MVYHFHSENQTVQTNSHRWPLPSLLNNHLKWNGEDRYDREISIVKES